MEILKAAALAICTMAALALYANKAAMAETGTAGARAQIVAPVKESVSAILIMPGGARLVVPMTDAESCVAFTQSIGQYVESADCFTNYE